MQLFQGSQNRQFGLGTLGFQGIPSPASQPLLGELRLDPVMALAQTAELHDTLKEALSVDFDFACRFTLVQCLYHILNRDIPAFGLLGQGEDVAQRRRR